MSKYRLMNYEERAEDVESDTSADWKQAWR